MSYTTPNSTIEYFGDLGIDPGHSNTLYFSTTIAKDNYFSALTQKVSESRASYVSFDKPFIRSSLSMASLYNKAYMRFKNTEFENKWFYAFIDKVVYANNGMTEVWYTLDPVMTWMGSFGLEQCFVEREHTTSDGKYEHLIDENMPCGDYIVSSRERLFPGDGEGDPYIVVTTSAVVVSSEGGSDVVSVKPAIYNGNMLSGASFESFPVSQQGKGQLIEYMDALIEDNKVDAIISMKILPKFMRPVGTNEESAPISPRLCTSTYGKPNSIGNYTPKNKKLLQYPYCLFTLNNTEGSSNEYRYEFFNSAALNFYIIGVGFDVPECAIFPRSYKITSEAGTYPQSVNVPEGLYMRQFPQSSIAVDQYKAWVAQMNSGGWQQARGKILAAGVSAGVVTANPIVGIGAAATSAIGEVMSAMSNSARYESIADNIIGAASSSLVSAISAKHFIMEHKHITEDYAKTIDDYFTMYGYKVNKVKRPQMNNRPIFTYVKTVDCQVTGGMPAPDARFIEQCFDRGIRFWKDHAQVGNYNLDNSPS